MKNWHPQIHVDRGAFAMIEMIKRLIYFFEKEKNWKERTSDVPKAFPIKNKESIEDKKK